MVISMEWGFCVLMRDEAVFVYCRCHSFRHRLAGCGQACIGEKDAKVSMWFTVQSHLLHLIYSIESLSAFDLQYSHILHLIYSTESLTAWDLQYIRSHFLHLIYSTESLTACDLLYRVTHCIWFTVQSHSLHKIYSTEPLSAFDLQ